jgi:hypothetical protein
MPAIGHRIQVDAASDAAAFFESENPTQIRRRWLMACLSTGPLLLALVMLNMLRGRQRSSVIGGMLHGFLGGLIWRVLRPRSPGRNCGRPGT